MIEKILERFREVGNIQFSSFSKPLIAVEDAIKIVQEESKNGGWIPCSERLPNNTDNVLITTRYGVVLMVFLGMSKNWCYLNGKRITDSQDMPIAWQPLPDPYIPKEEEQRG